jgi:hypothetical protein
MKNAFLKLALDSSINTAAVAENAGRTVFNVVTDAAGNTAVVGMDVLSQDDMLAAAADKGVAIGAKVREVMSNKYVLGGLAAVAVVGASYATYRLIKSRSDKKAVAAVAVAMTPEQKVEHARELLTQAQAELKAAPKVAVAA